MAEDFLDKEPGEMILMEIYLHQHAYSHGIFDIFHIYEFWSDASAAPSTPSFSTNCTEPDDLNRALLKMSNMDMMDTTEIQRRLTDCVEEDSKHTIIVFNSDMPADEYTRNESVDGLCPVVSNDIVPTVNTNNDRIIERQNIDTKNTEPVETVTSQTRTEAALLVIGNGFSSIPNEDLPSIASKKSPSPSIELPQISQNHNNLKSNETSPSPDLNCDGVLDKELTNDYVDDADSKSPPSEQSNVNSNQIPPPLIISSVSSCGSIVNGMGAISRFPGLSFSSNRIAQSNEMTPLLKSCCIIEGTIVENDVIESDFVDAPNNGSEHKGDRETNKSICDKTNSETIDMLEHVPRLNATLNEKSDVADNPKTKDKPEEQNGIEPDINCNKTLPPIDHINIYAKDQDHSYCKREPEEEQIKQATITLNRNVNEVRKLSIDNNKKQNVKVKYLFVRKRPANDLLDNGSVHSDFPTVRVNKNNAESTFPRIESVTSAYQHPKPIIINFKNSITVESLANGTSKLFAKSKNIFANLTQSKICAKPIPTKLPKIQSVTSAYKPTESKNDRFGINRDDRPSSRSKSKVKAFRYKCLECNQGLVTLSDKTTHMEKTGHKRMSYFPYENPSLSHSFGTKRIIATKTYSKKPSKKISSNENTSNKPIEAQNVENLNNHFYICQLCSIPTNNFDEYKKHMKTHSTHHICKQCFQIFPLSDQLAKHMKEHEQDKIFEGAVVRRREKQVMDKNGRPHTIIECTDCGLTFSTIRAHAAHTQIHCADNDGSVLSRLNVLN